MSAPTECRHSICEQLSMHSSLRECPCSTTFNPTPKLSQLLTIQDLANKLQYIHPNIDLKGTHTYFRV